MATRQAGVCQRIAPTRLGEHARQAMQRPRQRAFGRGSLASRACCERVSSPSGWHWNPAGAAKGGSVVAKRLALELGWCSEGRQ
jgi:hypothetical protein